MWPRIGSCKGLLAADHWDYVVIQEIFSGKEPEFEEYATKFDDEIKKAGSKTILFATANVTESYASGYHYPESFKTLNDMQIALGKKRGIPVAAAGYAWMKYLGPNPTDAERLDLYHTDKGHPGAKGSYIYACLLYAVITGNNPEGLISEFPKIRGGVAIPKEEAVKMQRAAWEQYQEGLKKKRGWAASPEVARVFRTRRGGGRGAGGGRCLRASWSPHPVATNFPPALAPKLQLGCALGCEAPASTVGDWGSVFPSEAELRRQERVQARALALGQEKRGEVRFDRMSKPAVSETRATRTRLIHPFPVP